MIKEIIGDSFMNCKTVKTILLQKGFTKTDIRRAKEMEGIKTFYIEKDGYRKWLWYLPEKVWDKYDA